MRKPNNPKLFVCGVSPGTIRLHLRQIVSNKKTEHQQIDKHKDINIMIQTYSSLKRKMFNKTLFKNTNLLYLQNPIC